MKHPIFLLLIIFGSLFSGNLHAQINLVKNGDFETRDTCPWGPDQIKIAKYWNCIDTPYFTSILPYAGNPDCSPEYINTCDMPYDVASAPHNPKFFQYPHGGNGMTNVLIYTDDSSLPSSYRRDYLQGHLSDTLTAGQSYCVTFFAVTANSAGYAVNNIGAYFDDGSIDTNSHCGLVHTEYTPQVYTTSIINDTLNWIKIQGSFIANGTERFITIGNFTDSAHTAQLRRNTNHYSYYEVDDVSVIATGSHAYAGPDVTIPAGSNAYIGVDTGSNGGGMPCYWYVLGGVAPIDSGGTIQVHPADTTTYVVAMDLCGTITYDTVTVNVTPCILPVASFTDSGTHTVSFVYTGTIAGVDSLVWNCGDSHTDTGMHPVHTYSANGTYTVCVTVYAACGNDTVCGSVVVSGVGLTDIPIANLKVYPNPANDELTITGVQQNTSYRLLNITSGCIKQGILMQRENTISIKKFVPGIYILEMTETNGARTLVRVVKK